MDHESNISCKCNKEKLPFLKIYCDDVYNILKITYNLRSIEEVEKDINNLLKELEDSQFRFFVYNKTMAKTHWLNFSWSDNPPNPAKFRQRIFLSKSWCIRSNAKDLRIPDKIHIPLESILKTLLDISDYELAMCLDEYIKIQCEYLGEWEKEFDPNLICKAKALLIEHIQVQSGNNSNAIFWTLMECAGHTYWNDEQKNTLTIEEIYNCYPTIDAILYEIHQSSRQQWWMLEDYEAILQKHNVHELHPTIKQRIYESVFKIWYIRQQINIFEKNAEGLDSGFARWCGMQPKDPLLCTIKDHFLHIDPRSSENFELLYKKLSRDEECPDKDKIWWFCTTYQDIPITVQNEQTSLENAKEVYKHERHHVRWLFLRGNHAFESIIDAQNEILAYLSTGTSVQKIEEILTDPKWLYTYRLSWEKWEKHVNQVKKYLDAIAKCKTINLDVLAIFNEYWDNLLSDMPHFTNDKILSEIVDVNL